jgi:Asp-tRNA(Asn)/Glu-tRNA(Gln) amidotransferase A subunit family amidase
MTAGWRSSPKIVLAFRDRAEVVNGDINAIVTTRDESAAEAGYAERAYRAHRARPLEGVPFTVKDTIETAGIRTTAGSRTLEHNVPTRDAPAVARLREAGAMLLGKTNAPEFAMTFGTDNLVFGKTRNPWDFELSPGGSSGGEGAAIASGCSPLGLGSDLAGSMRIPANFCRVCGLRPTVGRVPGGGHIPLIAGPLAPLSVIGPMARHVEDIDLVMRVLADDWNSDLAGADGLAANGVTSIGFFVDAESLPTTDSVKGAVSEAVDLMVAHGLAVREVRVPHFEELVTLWDEIWCACGGAAGLLARYKLPVDQLSPPLAKLIELSPPHDPDRAAVLMDRIRDIRRMVVAFMADFPLIICPVAAGPPTHRPGRWTIDGQEYAGAQGFGFAYGWSLLGFPALAVPTTSGGVQIVGQPGEDELTVAAGRIIQRGNVVSGTLAGEAAAR